MGDAFEEALRLDATGACYPVIPDCPIFDYKNPNFYLLFAIIGLGRIICQPLAFRSYGVREVFIFVGLFLSLLSLLVYYLVF